MGGSWNKKFMSDTNWRRSLNNTLQSLPVPDGVDALTWSDQQIPPDVGHWFSSAYCARFLVNIYT